MADFEGRKRGKSHVQNMGIFLGGSGHGAEASCQISAYYKFFPGKSYFYRNIFHTGNFLPFHNPFHTKILQGASRAKLTQGAALKRNGTSLS